MFVYVGTAEDDVSVSTLGGLLRDALDAAPDQLKQQLQDQRKTWELRRFVDIALQARLLSSESAVSAAIDTVYALALAIPSVREYVLHGELVVLSARQDVSKKLYWQLPRGAVMQIVRRTFIETKCSIPNPSFYSDSSFCRALVPFALRLVEFDKAIVNAFVTEVCVCGYCCNGLY